MSRFSELKKQGLTNREVAKTITERAIDFEDSIIGNLKEQFYAPNLHSQRMRQISPSLAVGNIALAFYRGLQAGREEQYKDTLILLKDFPDAVKLLKTKKP